MKLMFLFSSMILLAPNVSLATVFGTPRAMQLSVCRSAGDAQNGGISLNSAHCDALPVPTELKDVLKKDILVQCLDSISYQQNLTGTPQLLTNENLLMSESSGVDVSQDLAVEINFTNGFISVAGLGVCYER